jgi:hypothetical protein
MQATAKQELGSGILDSIMNGCATAQVNLNGLGPDAAGGAAAYICTAIQEVFAHAVSPLCAPLPAHACMLARQSCCIEKHLRCRKHLAMCPGVSWKEAWVLQRLQERLV